MAVRSAARGLSAEELEHVRAALAAGRRPKVVFTAAAGQIAGQLGQVVALTDPAHSEEWVVVRFGRDELPFSPTDLAIAPKGAAARRPSKPARQAPAGPASAPGAPLLPPAEPAPLPARRAAAASGTKPAAAALAVTSSAAPPAAGPAGAVPVPREVGAGAHAAAAPDGDGASPAAASGGIDGAATAAGGSTSRGRQRAGRPAAKAARRSPRGRQPAALTVTVTYADGEWTVAAEQGGKVLAKPYLIKASEALKMVGMLDIAGVQEAVEEIVAADRAEAEATAERLRAELAEVEARLAELRDTP